MYRGWLVADKGEDKFLTNLGINIIKTTLGTKETVEHQVTMSDETMNKLDKHWHRFYWELKHGSD